VPAGFNDLDRKDEMPQGLNSPGQLPRARRGARPAPSSRAKKGEAAVAGGFPQIGTALEIT
jgi:hypothetical protein